jgi:voltage-gated potassium channel
MNKKTISGSGNMQFNTTTGMRRQLLAGFLGVVATLFGGSLGYYLIGRGRWTFEDCLYMTAISLTTVGYGEIIDVGAVAGARIYTMVLILLGMGVIVYFASMVVAFIVEGELKQYFGRKKMIKEIQKLHNHIILCGAGSTGTSVIQEMLATRTPFVVIDENEEQLKKIMADDGTGPFLYVIGDVSADHVLVQAGIREARGLIAALPEDKDNLFLIISARQLNPKLRIVSRGIEPNIAEKLMRAGADSVVSPNHIGGMRMASEMIRPRVVEFLDVMLRDKERTLRVEEVAVHAGSQLAGLTLKQADIRSRADVLVVAAKSPQGVYTHNPTPDFVLEPGTVLILIGVVDEMEKLRKICIAANQYC